MATSKRIALLAACAIASVSCINHQDLGSNDAGATDTWPPDGSDAGISADVRNDTTAMSDAVAIADASVTDGTDAFVSVDTSVLDASESGSSEDVIVSADAPVTDATTDNGPIDSGNSTPVVLAMDVTDCTQSATHVYCVDTSGHLISIRKSDGMRTSLAMVGTTINTLSSDGVGVFWYAYTGSVDPLSEVFRFDIAGGTVTEIAATNYETSAPTFAFNGEVYFLCYGGASMPMSICVAPRGNSHPDQLTGNFSTSSIPSDLEPRNARAQGAYAVATDGSDVFYYYPGTTSPTLSNPVIIASQASTHWPVYTETEGAVFALAATTDNFFAIQVRTTDQSIIDLTRVSRATSESVRLATLPNTNFRYGHLFADDTHTYVWGESTSSLLRVPSSGGALETIDSSTAIVIAFTDTTSIYWIAGQSLKTRAR